MPQHFTPEELDSLESLTLSLDGGTERILIKQAEINLNLQFSFPAIAAELRRLWSEEERLKWLDPEMCHGEDNEGRCFLCHSEEGQECASCIAHAE